MLSFQGYERKREPGSASERNFACLSAIGKLHGPYFTMCSNPSYTFALTNSRHEGEKTYSLV